MEGLESVITKRDMAKIDKIKEGRRESVLWSCHGRVGSGTAMVGLVGSWLKRCRTQCNGLDGQLCYDPWCGNQEECGKGRRDQGRANNVRKSWKRNSYGWTRGKG